jgi:negative regulator of sigma E activity
LKKNPNEPGRNQVERISNNLYKNLVMDNQDKLFNQIKRSCRRGSTLQAWKVWARVDETRPSNLATKLWKVAIAASVLLVVSLGYQLTKTNTTVSVLKIGRG